MEDIKLVEETLKSFSLRVYNLLQKFDFHTADTGLINSSGDHVNNLDDMADHMSEEVFKECELIYGFISEEREDLVITNAKGKYIVTIDPLDGSQNIDVGFNVGAIFGVYETQDVNSLKNGRDLVGAGYTIFSTSLQFIFAKEIVNMHRYNFDTQKWCCYMNHHGIPNKGKIYSLNEGISNTFYDDISSFVANHMKGRSLRWMSCMVTDVHRSLMQGGCFLYPQNKKSKDGKLRLVYELYPMAYIWEKCGGCAYLNMDKDAILDEPFPIDNLHKKHGCILLGPYESTLV